MTMPPQQIEVVCPKCELPYQSWYRPSMNLQLDDFDAEYIEKMSTATCPNCGHKVPLDALVVRPDGVWEFGPGGSPPSQPLSDG